MFDPIRRAVLLLGGDKTGRWRSWYETAIIDAERIYTEYRSSSQYQLEERQHRQQGSHDEWADLQAFRRTRHADRRGSGPSRRGVSCTRTRNAEILTYNLAELRKSREITQAEVSRVLGIGQPRVSRIERGESLRLDTLRAYVQALGGRLEIAAVFDDDQRVTLDVGDELRPTG